MSHIVRLVTSRSFFWDFLVCGHRVEALSENFRRVRAQERVCPHCESEAIPERREPKKRGTRGVDIQLSD